MHMHLRVINIIIHVSYVILAIIFAIFEFYKFLKVTYRQLIPRVKLNPSKFQYLVIKYVFGNLDKGHTIDGYMW